MNRVIKVDFSLLIIHRPTSFPLALTWPKSLRLKHILEFCFLCIEIFLGRKSQILLHQDCKYLNRILLHQSLAKRHGRIVLYQFR